MGQLLGRRNRRDFQVPGGKEDRGKGGKRVSQASDGEEVTIHVKSQKGMATQDAPTRGQMGMGGAEIRILMRASFSWREIVSPSNCIKRQIEIEQLCVCVFYLWIPGKLGGGW